VHALRPEDAGSWDEFVVKSDESTFFHLSCWKEVIEQAFGYATYYRIVKRGEAITGILPLTHVKSRLFGNKLISNAFAMYGGPVAQDDDSRRALEGEAERIMRVLRVPVLEFRNIKPHRSDWATRSDLYATFRKPLFPTVPQNLKAIPPGQSKVIRNRATRNGLYSEVDQDIDRLYHIYSESVRNLGTPVYSKKYFNILKNLFPDNCHVLTVMHGKTPVASVMSVQFRKEIMTLYGGGTAAAPALGANVFMYWEVMRLACERGCELFDFGRSKLGTGAYAFKRNWGFEPTALAYQYKLANGWAIPDQNPLNPKYQPLIAAWKWLPLPVANLIGPPIAKAIG